jgi:galactonate dehydratase
MKITKVEAIGVSRYLYAKIHTDEGITGIGESGSWGYLEASKAAIELFGRYLVGKDPLRIEHHWQYMYRFSHFRGAAIMGALSALDIAMWDIMGKNFGVPVHQLLGGKTRDKARVYYHVFGDTKEKLVQGIKDAKDLGFTAVGHLTPFRISRLTQTRSARLSTLSARTEMRWATMLTSVSRFTAA